MVLIIMMMMMMKRRNFLRLLVNLPVLSLECTLPAQDFRLMQPDGEVDDEDGVNNGDDDGVKRVMDYWNLHTLFDKICFTSGWDTWRFDNLREKWNSTSKL